MLPSARVLDLFAVPDPVQPLPGGQGRSVRAGDLVLSPDRGTEVHGWLSPLLARLAVRLDQDPMRGRQDLRVAVPVPARDGNWVVEGWAASRYEPGTVVCRDLDVIRAAGNLLHAQLALLVTRRPAELDRRTDRWAAAERLAFGEAPIPTGNPDLTELISRARAAIGDGLITGSPQLVHADLAQNVLLDPAGAPLVIDVAPAWRPAQWADAVCVLDVVLGWQTSLSALRSWAHGARRAAMVHAIMFRLLSDDPPDLDAYAGALAAIGA